MDKQKTPLTVPTYQMQFTSAELAALLRAVGQQNLKNEAWCQLHGKLYEAVDRIAEEEDRFYGGGGPRGRIGRQITAQHMAFHAEEEAA